MSTSLHKGRDAQGIEIPSLKLAGWGTLLMGVVFAFALDALIHRLAGWLDRLEITGDAFPMPGAPAGILLSVAIIALVLGRDVPLGYSLRFLRSVMLLVCAVVLADPLSRVLLHLLAPDFAASLVAFILRAVLAVAALGGLVLFLTRERLLRFVTSAGGDDAPPSTS